MEEHLTIEMSVVGLTARSHEVLASRGNTLDGFAGVSFSCNYAHVASQLPSGDRLGALFTQKTRLGLI